MYSKEEAAKLRHEFWIAFGRYMQPVPSATGEPVNWLNYKTGIKGIQFKKDALQKYAFVSIDIRGDEFFREKIFGYFKSLYAIFSPEWQWYPNAIDEHGKEFSRIIIEEQGINLFDKEQWPVLISFFKNESIFFDALWAEHGEILMLL